MKQISLTIFSVLMIGTMLFPISTSAQQQRGAGTATLDADAKAALIEVLSGTQGEYAARASYRAILDKFGSGVQPYANILIAEEKHITALVEQCKKYGVPVPADPWSGNVIAPETLLDAAWAGISAELLNVDMYNMWVAKVAKYPSLVQVFTNLRDASLLNHLPAFEAAAENGGSLP